MPSELTELFERTMPEEQVVLERMNAARVRRTREPKSSWPKAVGGVACVGACAAVFALLGRAPAPALRAEAERLAPAPAPARAASAALEVLPTVRAVPQASAVPVRTASKRSATSAAPSVSATPSASTAPAPPPASWEAAARAMREGDQAEAQRLLAELSKSDEPEVRDSALLVRLRSARPHLSGAEQAQLEGLARSGATASIRSDARKLLEELQAAER